MSDKGIYYKTGYENTGYPWHVDENGCFWWGTPAARAERIEQERRQSLAPLPLEPMCEPEPEPSPDREQERGR